MADETTPATQPAAPAAAPLTPPPPSPPSAPAEKTQAEKMDAVLERLAGKGPPKTEPAAPPAKPAEPEPPKTEPAAKKSGFQEGRRRIEAKAAKLEAKLNETRARMAELEAKAKTGELTEVEQLRAEQLTEQSEQLYEEIKHDYNVAAAEALGDGYDAFADGNRYYAPLLNRDAPDFAMAVGRMENHFKPLSVLYSGFTEGTVNYGVFAKLPYPSQMHFFRKIAEQLEKAAAAPPAAPASPPPVVPNPRDLPAGRPKEGNAKMEEILRSLAKYHG